MLKDRDLNIERDLNIKSKDPDFADAYHPVKVYRDPVASDTDKTDQYLTGPSINFKSPGLKGAISGDLGSDISKNKTQSTGLAYYTNRTGGANY